MLSKDLQRFILVTIGLVFLIGLSLTSYYFNYENPIFKLAIATGASFIVLIALSIPLFIAYHEVENAITTQTKPRYMRIILLSGLSCLITFCIVYNYTESTCSGECWELLGVILYGLVFFVVQSIILAPIAKIMLKLKTNPNNHARVVAICIAVLLALISTLNILSHL